MTFVVNGEAATGGQRRQRRRPSRRRLWAGIIGAVIGWGLAGLDGGVAGTSAVPRPSVDFVAAGTLTAPTVGTVLFDLASSGGLVRQVVVVENGRVDMVYDREAGTVTIVDADAVVIRRNEPGERGLFEPFARAASIADAPLEIVRDGIGSHLGHACERFRGTGTTGGMPVAVRACLTADGIPLVAELIGAGPRMRTELTDLRVGAPDPEHFVIPSDRAVIDLTGG